MKPCEVTFCMMLEVRMSERELSWAVRRAVNRGRGPVWTQGDAQDVGRLRGLNRVALWTSENARKELFFCERSVSKQPLAIKDSNALTVCFKWIFVLKKAFVVHSCEKRLDATGFKGQRTRGCCFMSRSQHYKCTLKTLDYSCIGPHWL